MQNKQLLRLCNSSSSVSDTDKRGSFLFSTADLTENIQNNTPCTPHSCQYTRWQPRPLQRFMSTAVEVFDIVRMFHFQSFINYVRKFKFNKLRVKFPFKISASLSCDADDKTNHSDSDKLLLVLGRYNFHTIQTRKADVKLWIKDYVSWDQRFFSNFKTEKNFIPLSKNYTPTAYWDGKIWNISQLSSIELHGWMGSSLYSVLDVPASSHCPVTGWFWVIMVCLGISSQITERCLTPDHVHLFPHFSNSLPTTLPTYRRCMFVFWATDIIVKQLILAAVNGNER